MVNTGGRARVAQKGEIPPQGEASGACQGNRRVGLARQAAAVDAAALAAAAG
jgi:hypothetical protein